MDDAVEDADLAYDKPIWTILPIELVDARFRRFEKNDLGLPDVSNEWYSFISMSSERRVVSNEMYKSLSGIFIFWKPARHGRYINNERPTSQVVVVSGYIIMCDALCGIIWYMLNRKLGLIVGYWRCAAAKNLTTR